MLAAAVGIWLLGLVAGWCAGWAARGGENRAWHRGLVHQLDHTRAQLDQALDQLDHALAELDHTRTETAKRVPPTPAVCVHLDAALPSWLAPRPAPVNTSQLSTAMPVLPAKE